MHVDVEHLSFASSSFRKLSLNAFFGGLFACVGRVKHRGLVVLLLLQVSKRRSRSMIVRLSFSSTLFPAGCRSRTDSVSVMFLGGAGI